jgi:hypothetical protein
MLNMATKEKFEDHARKGDCNEYDRLAAERIHEEVDGEGGNIFRICCSPGEFL